MLANFKGKSIKKFHPTTTMAIADSPQDLPVLRQVQYPIIVAKRIRPWMRTIDAKIIFNNKLISI
jgi:predicted mannosyl-3-phosphoglycerate phosphatase (HAD superfamily)